MEIGVVQLKPEGQFAPLACKRFNAGRRRVLETKGGFSTDNNCREGCKLRIP